jgi:RNA binding activity-knot of a chromodomain
MTRAGARRGGCWLLLGALVLSACKRPYRVGEHVLVEWEEGKLYPAHVLEAHGPARYRVHFDGYDTHWDEDVGLDRIRGRVQGPVPAPPPPAKVTRAAGAPTGSGGSLAEGINPFHEGDRIRVTWRGSVYAALVLQPVGRDHVLIHYEGLESAWDEVVALDRIVSRRR